MVKQVGLLPAGCQPWNMDIMTTSGNRFVYCATLAIYVYELDKKFNEFRLVSIMAEHKKTINSICFHPNDPDIIVSAGADRTIFIWNIAEQQVVAKLHNTIKESPKAVGWTRLSTNEEVCFIQGRGPLNVWNYRSGVASIRNIREASGFASDVTLFRWHPKNHSMIVLGHINGSLSICTVGGKSFKCICPPESLEDSNDDDPVTALEWDPLSNDYLIISNTINPVRLIDASSQTVITEFRLPSIATRVHTFAWISGAPGMFVTGDTQNGILRVWNVSKTAPIESISIKKTGIHALKTVSVTLKSKKKDIKSKAGKNVSSNSETHSPSAVTSSRFALPPAKVICAFLDGGIGLYDLGGRKWDFLREEGHIETIFDCKFCPNNPDYLATASFDGSLKVWDVNTLKAVESSPGNEGVVYSLSWAPSDLNCIVASTSKNGIFIWDIGRKRIIKRFHEHGKQSVFSVAWNQKDPKRIMSAGGDGFCVIRQVDGELVQKYKHPGAVYGCDWSPNNKDMLATGCDDKCVRVYYLPTISDQPLKVFSGHTAKVFHIRWSPLREGILASGSDDRTIRVWDYTQDSCVSVLNGHEGPVRGILWNTEIPYLLISGSWDYTVRIWDVRDGACVETLLDHGADVYGLTTHPERPFLLASSSRDSTVRLWSLTSLIQPIEINIIVQKPWSEILGTLDSAMALGNPPLLTGKASKDLKSEIESVSSSKSRERMLRLCSKFFSTPNGTNNLWELVSVLKGVDNALLSENYKNGIVHVKHIVKFMASEAQELEMIKMSKTGGGIGTPSRAERIREAANISIKIGNIQRYCELMVELGEWERAIAVAPGVSLEYWKSLTKRYADFLAYDDDEKTVPFSAAIGGVESLVNFFSVRGQYKDAVVMAQVACEGMYASQQTLPSSQNTGLCNGVDKIDPSYDKLLKESIDNLAEWYVQNGSPVLAACCHLAADNEQKAMWRLIQGHELELAAAVGLVLGNTPKQTNLALEYLSRRCEHIGKWELAVDLLKLIPDNELLLFKCCARCSASAAEKDYLHTKARIPSLENCYLQAESLRNQSDMFECVKYYLVSASPDIGLDIGLQDVKKRLSKEVWTVSDVFPMLQLLGSIRSDKLHQQKVERMRLELLCLSSYVGALMAIQYGYDDIVMALYRHAGSLLVQGELSLPITKDMFREEAAAWSLVQEVKLKQFPEPLDLSKASLAPNVLSVYQNLIRKAEADLKKNEIGPEIQGSSHLPSHSDVHISYITHRRVLGLAYFLEDGKSAISPNEALMWAKVNPFSPLGLGLRINPF